MSASVKIAFITTVLNEAETILDLLHSLNTQTLLPSEVVIVDGGSKDQTVAKILEFQKSSRNKLKIKLIKAKGNRSIGRNTGIRNSNSEIIAISDAGCSLDKNWLKEITKPFGDKTIDVVSGFYGGVASTPFQEALIPYVLVMNPDPENFIPATRSMALKKTVWEKEKFNEKLSNNEDFAFGRGLKQKGYKIYFARKAIVFWVPRTNLSDAFEMFYRFAKGDIEAKIVRKKVVFIFARYAIGVLILFTSPFLAFILLCLYGAWSIYKNHKNVKYKSALLYLPILQFTSDLAVLMGTIRGFFQKF